MKSRTLRSKCPHLADWKFKACEAPEIPYSPSQFQLEEYCSNVSHTRCPLYLDAADSRTLVSVGRTNKPVKVR
jgi:hypothetical protein